MIDEKKILRGTELVLEGLGADIENDENYKETPMRVLKAYRETLEGHFLDMDEKLSQIFSKSFPSTYKGIIAEKNIKCFSMCPHHMQVVEYNVSVGYISDNKKGKMAGLSKLPRAIKFLAKRMELQETFTQNIVDAIMKHLNASGSMVIVKGKHNCMRVRGVEQIDCETITSSVAGLFSSNPPAREEFLSLINN
jgi:GTP cyclohydrolase IA